MVLLRRLILIILTLLFTTFGSVVAFAAPGGDWSQVNYPVVVQELNAQPVNLTNNARAPPTASANVMASGIALAQTGNLRALDGVESTGAVYAFLQSSIAPNSVDGLPMSNTGQGARFTETGTDVHLDGAELAIFSSVDDLSVCISCAPRAAVVILNELHCIGKVCGIVFCFERSGHQA